MAAKLRGGWLLPAFPSTTAWAVDVIGFLALGGLFTAHITGMVVILAAHYVSGGFSEVAPLLAVPVFVTLLSVVTLATMHAKRAGYRPRRALLVLQGALPAGCLGLGVGFGPFGDAERPMAVFVGMLAVAAMATQNALVKLPLTGAPSTALMTTNTTQLTVDLATLAWGRGEPGDLAKARYRAGVIRFRACSVSWPAEPPGPPWKSTAASGRWRCRSFLPLPPSRWANYGVTPRRVGATNRRARGP